MTTTANRVQELLSACAAITEYVDKRCDVTDENATLVGYANRAMWNLSGKARETLTAPLPTREGEADAAGFTPGPWWVTGDLYIAGEDVYVADCGFSDLSGNTATANARLIAAAPDLYAALKAAVSVIVDMRRENRLHGHITDASARYLHKIEPQIVAALAAVREGK